MTISISAVGDISLGDHPVCVGHGMRKMFSEKKSSLLHEAKKYIQPSDLALGNLETVASNIGLSKFWLPSYEMRGNPSSLSYLKDLGFSVLGVANNHAMQHGIETFHDCLENIKREGFDIIGVDNKEFNTEVFTFSKRDTTINLFALSIRPEEWHNGGKVPYSYRENRDAILAEVKALRKKKEGFLICSIHWGLEFLTDASPLQVDLGHALIDSGVDVILGHHPHVLQPIEYYNDGLIFYSLGNFAFDLWDDSTKLTGVVRLQLKQGMKPKYNFEPMVIKKDFQIRDASEEEKKEIFAILNSKISVFEKENYKKLQAAYEDRYILANKKFRYSSYKYFLRNFHRYPFHFLVQSLARTVIRRVTGT
ncbi:CapA family protein [Marinobacter sp. 1Y8]